jgi:AcrR family transcriptional regulator
MANPPQRPADADRQLWFSLPDGQDICRRALTRGRVVAGALYRHVRSKEQLCDLVVDGVLAEVDCDTCLASYDRLFPSQDALPAAASCRRDIRTGSGLRERGRPGQRNRDWIAVTVDAMIVSRQNSLPCNVILTAS